VISQDDGHAIARVLCCRTPEQETWLPTMYQGTGIDTRRLVLPQELVRDLLDGTRLSGSVFLPRDTDDDSGPTTAQRMEHYARLAPPLAVAASRKALEQSAIDARTITHLITVTCTGFIAPGLDLALIRGLNLPPTVERTQVGFMGCHGALNGLRVARAFSLADPSAKILLCATELCSLHYFYGWNPQKIIANALFSDGAASIVATGAGVGFTGPMDAWRVTATASCLIPDSTTAMTWTVGNHGFEMTLSKRVPGLIAENLRPFLETWLGKQGLTLSQIGSWAIHPGGPRILTAVEEALALPPSATAVSRQVFAENGNMSSPTVLFILDRLRRLGAARPCVAMGFGPGLMAEMVLLQ
jgi:predicted naringenin-chalcone synthase